MKTRISTISKENVLFLLIGALFYSALITLGGGGYVSGDVLMFSFVAFILSLTPLFFLKTAVLKSHRVRNTYLPMVPRKEITHRNDPLLM